MSQPTFMANLVAMTPASLAAPVPKTEISHEIVQKPVQKSLMPCAICYKFFPQEQLQNHILSHQKDQKVSSYSNKNMRSRNRLKIYYFI